MTKLLLLDFNALLHRSRNALLRTGKQYTTSEGIPTTGVFSTLGSILSIIDKQKPTHVVTIFDAGGNKRKSEDEDYKANRKPADPDFICESRILLNEAMYALGIESVGLRGYEADDILWTYAHVGQFGIDRFDEIVIATVDQDLLQCVTERCSVLLYNSSKKQQMMDTDAVIEKWGCYPDQIGLIKALSGDSSDNIKGIKGVGPKTALKICQESGWEPDVIKTHKRVCDHIERFDKNMDLVGLRLCVGELGPIRWDDYKLGLGMTKDWEQFLSKYELSGLAKRVAKTKVMMQLQD